jgi:hypothetical protein
MTACAVFGVYQLSVFVGCSPAPSGSQATPTAGGYGGAVGGDGSGSAGTSVGFRGGRGGGTCSTRRVQCDEA